MNFAPVDSALRERRGLCLVTGTAADREALSRHIADSGGRDTYVACLKAPVYCEEDLVERLLIAYGVVSDNDVQSRERAGLSLEQLVEALRAFLMSLVQINATAILVLDDAQDLPEPVFECMGLLTDLEHRGMPLLQMVIAGSSELRKVLGRPRFAPLAERVVFDVDVAAESSRLQRTRVSLRAAAFAAFVTAVIAAAFAAFFYQRWGF